MKERLFQNFAFLRVGNNATVVGRELNSIIRQPPNFICINDEVDYTREDTALVQAALRGFFQTLFPVPSLFELPDERRNLFSHVDQLCLWSVRSILPFPQFSQKWFAFQGKWSMVDEICFCYTFSGPFIDWNLLLCESSWLKVCVMIYTLLIFKIPRCKSKTQRLIQKVIGRRPSRCRRVIRLNTPV